MTRSAANGDEQNRERRSICAAKILNGGCRTCGMHRAPCNMGCRSKSVPGHSRRGAHFNEPQCLAQGHPGHHGLARLSGSKPVSARLYGAFLVKKFKQSGALFFDRQFLFSIRMQSESPSLLIEPGFTHAGTMVSVGSAASKGRRARELRVHRVPPGVKVRRFSGTVPKSCPV